MHHFHYHEGILLYIHISLKLSSIQYFRRRHMHHKSKILLGKLHIQDRHIDCCSREVEYMDQVHIHSLYMSHQRMSKMVHRYWKDLLERSLDLCLSMVKRCYESQS
jgi:hypothetical protein